MKTEKSIVRGKTWIGSIQGWSWIITILWMTIANIRRGTSACGLGGGFWKPFGLYGLVCMFTPIVIALCGRGKMHCARVCPRGSFIGLFTKKISIGMKKAVCDSLNRLCETLGRLAYVLQRKNIENSLQRRLK